MADFTVCVLLYGDYVTLARRCLGSLWHLPEGTRIRIAMNEVGIATRQFVTDWIADHPVELLIDNAENKHKYPAMRELFYVTPITTPFVMWFDDDSYIKAATPEWWQQTAYQMQAADMLGSLYTISLRGGQYRWIERQPWYSRQPVSSNHRVTFAQGAWWCARADLLRQVDWPSRELDHRGGDVMLGEVCRQQGWRLRQAMRHLVAINADGEGRESGSPRRGFDSTPIGVECF